MNLTLADMVRSIPLPSFESVSSAAYCVGKTAYQGGTLALASGVGVYVAVQVCDNISNPTLSKIVGFVAGLLTTMAIFALTNPFTPLKDVLLFSAITLPVTSLIVATVVINTFQSLSDAFDDINKLLAGAFVISGLVGTTTLGWYLSKN